MSALWKEFGVIALALLATAAMVYRLGDRGILVPPPETAAEEFVKKLTTGRFAPARSHLAESLVGRVTTDSLRSIAVGLQARAGEITKVESELGAATGDTSRALVTLVGAGRHTLELDLPLVWERGTWKVADVPPCALAGC